VSLLDLFNFTSAGKKISIQPANIAFETGKHQTVLESGLAQGLAMPHSCTVGTCGSCKCTLKEGKIREITNFAYVLSAEELRSNVILTCQAMAKTDLVLEIEDFEPKKLHPPEDFTGQIIDQKDVTQDIREVTIELDRPIAFDAGQYVQVSVNEIFGARSYSFAMAPQEGGNQTISLFIRKVPGGEFTGALFDGKLDQTELHLHRPRRQFLVAGRQTAPSSALLEAVVWRRY
jgi:Na+-transporting NADH:ubiquinone oxidoreductase, subunit NqrF